MLIAEQRSIRVDWEFILPEEIESDPSEKDLFHEEYLHPLGVFPL